MRTVSLHTLGCKLNFAETATIAEQFAAHDFSVVPFGKPSDVTVINTCSVTDEADRKCRQAIRRAIRTNKDSFVIVTGCYAQLSPEDVASIPGVDAVLGTAEKLAIFDVLKSFEPAEKTQTSVSCIDDAATFEAAFSAGERTRAFLKIQDGCDYTCSFCTIPMARGMSRSQSIDATVRQAHRIADRGHREIVLSGVNIGLFGTDTGESLLDLLRELDRVDGIDRYRISSIEPNLLTDEIIEFVAGSQRFMPHFHIPLQSGDDFVLGKMRRRYRRSLYSHRIDTIRSLIPDAAIGVDVIVGFPAETEERFGNTRAFLNGLPITYIHAFTYSERRNTAAVEQLDRMEGSPVARPERSRRNQILRLLSERKRNEFARLHIGQRRPVLWEGKVSAGKALGFTDNYIRVCAPAGTVREGTIDTVLLDRMENGGMVAAAPPEFEPIA